MRQIELIKGWTVLRIDFTCHRRECEIFLWMIGQNFI
jgi:hypothetical protein